ncbi:putative NBD/HSP70 family sugar kinase [Actinoalloteichus hoggarensis]|uniref:N-acetylglucosamine repressor n=1 Tax=Actinoalloteichus hoggarensis TaxID=1470176 RepID=A0A221W0E1_9PSEU|nr:ROK family transcriptional regulator [Actinoalloteichus hoggarensis]ASO19224.1 N-acetylglucosamine repressor [Actinoalloteichus hoggarensis]MBB5920461.1 putative NBD/HSP70 family sugar kinase [Actinoalloteichus hoggarensis]
MALGARPDGVRRHNRSALLRRLHTLGPGSRTELAAELGLNRSTIKALVDGLTEAGLVTERAVAPDGTAGRPSLLVSPRPESLCVLAVDVAVERITVAVVGFGGRILVGRHRRAQRGDTEPGAVVDLVAAVAGALSLGGLRPAEAAVSVPGIVRGADGLVHEAPNLRWSEVPIGARLGAALGLPVAVGNDADLGALAEHRRGVARGVGDVVYLSADVGVGGGVITGGLPLRGSTGHVGEVGHMVLRPGGRLCYCGCRGCWETEVGEQALARALGLPSDASRRRLVTELRAIAEGEDTDRRLGEYANWLGVGVVNLVNLLAPELVVLGGLLAELPPDLVTNVESRARDRSLVGRAAARSVRIRPAQLGGQASLLGAAELAFERVIAAG